MRTYLTLLVVALLLGITSIAQNKTVWRGGTDGIYPDTGLLNTWPENGPEILWSFQGLSEGHSSPAFALNHIFISTMIEKNGYIIILDMNGKEVKRYQYGEEFFESFPGSRSTPVIVDDWLYVYSGKGVIYAFDAMEGTLRWKKEMLSETDGENIRWGVTETLVVDNNKLFVSPGGKTQNVMALNRLNGDVIWTSKGVGDLSAYCTPLLIDLPNRKLLVTMMASHTSGFDANTGDMLWSFEQPNKWNVHANTPLFHNGILVLTSGYGYGTSGLKLAADGSSVEKLWFNEKFDNRMGGVVALGGYLYSSGDKNREWRCLDIKTGEEKWASTTVGKGVVIAADNKLYLYSDRGELAMAKASPEAFEVLSQTKVELGTAQHWAHPVINNGILYLRHGDVLIAYKVK